MPRTSTVSAAAALYSRFIELGLPGTEAILSRGLELYGNRQMAEVFLNSGNGTLETAARRWADHNGVRIQRTIIDPGGTKWGGKRP